MEIKRGIDKAVEAVVAHLRGAARSTQDPKEIEQLLSASDYEKLLGLVQAGESLPGLLAHKANGPYRERDFAAWLHSPGAPSDEPRLSVLETRWEEMTDRLVHDVAGASTPNASTATPNDSAITTDT